MPIVNGEYRRPQLRNGKINYRFGWFFVTFQVFENKSELVAIVGECCVLNALGAAVKNLIETLKMPVISTFTSSQERAILRKLISLGRRFIAVYPGGIPKVLPDEIKNLVDSGNALLLSPVESGTGVNKQLAIWCNEYLITRAQEVWCGYIKPGGILESILKGIGGKLHE